MISILLSAALTFAVPSQQDGPARGQGPAFEVAVGSGEVAPALVAEVRELTAQRLDFLRPTFRGLEPQRFAVFVHGAAESLPPALAALRHPGAPGFALLGRHQIHLVVGDMKRTGTRLESVVTHELVHELLDQFVAPHGARIPRWFHEGLAQYLAGDVYLGVREQDIVWRVAVRRLLPWYDLERGFPRDEDALGVAYAQSYSYVAWLVREFGLDDVIAAAGNVDDDTDFDRAIVGATGRPTLELGDGWQRYLQYGSGAWWRVLLGRSFDLLLILALPAFAVAVLRRRSRARKLRQRMERHAELYPADFELEPAPMPPLELHGPPPPEIRP
ncbi:MAG: hypothetical protein KDE27_17900 [Planctomycetes bacterium]|nr:hypothetical protein [Planctomycetota bacterium]